MRADATAVDPERGTPGGAAHPLRSPVPVAPDPRPSARPAAVARRSHHELLRSPRRSRPRVGVARPRRPRRRDRAARVVRRESARPPSGARATSAEPARAEAVDTENADALERAADEAERDGDLDRRAPAALPRRDCSGSATAARSRTGRRSPPARSGARSTRARFDDLAGTFEAVTYGGRTADPPAVDSARREWPRVLEETGRR